jgi:hypothetical protein
MQDRCKYPPLFRRVAPRGAERHGKVYPHVDESSRVESSTNLEIKDITDSVWSR